MAIPIRSLSTCDELGRDESLFRAIHRNHAADRAQRTDRCHSDTRERSGHRVLVCPGQWREAPLPVTQSRSLRPAQPFLRPTLPRNVTGLTNGDTYSFTVTRDQRGRDEPALDGRQSDAPHRARCTDERRRHIRKLAGHATWDPPTNNGGSTITSYAVNGTPMHRHHQRRHDRVVPGLTNGQSYTFRRFRWEHGWLWPRIGPFGGRNAGNRSRRADQCLGKTPGNGQASVTWSAPANTGGDPITGYTVTVVEPAPPSRRTSPSATVTGLTNGNSYTFTVTATTIAGIGAASSPSSAIIPATVPDAPTNVMATAGIRQATVSWTAPSNERPDHHPATPSRRPDRRDRPRQRDKHPQSRGLANGQSYTFTVTATNAIGTSAAASPSASITE